MIRPFLETTQPMGIAVHPTGVTTMANGTVSQHFGTTIKIARLIGGGRMSELAKNAAEFVDDINRVTPFEDEACVESNRAGLCVVAFIRLKDYDEMNAVEKKFKEHGWRTR